jgi:hypothetical protein
MVKASKELEACVDESVRVSIKHGYRPVNFMRMRDDLGALGTIKRLVINGELQSGFRRLKKLGIVEWSLEQAVRNFPREFSKAEIECAHWRIETLRNTKA